MPVCVKVYLSNHHFLTTCKCLFSGCMCMGVGGVCTLNLTDAILGMKRVLFAESLFEHLYFVSLHKRAI